MTSSGPWNAGCATVHASAWTIATASRIASGPGTRRSRPVTRLAPAPETQDGEEERREEDLDADDQEGRRQDGEALLGEVPEAALGPLDQDHADDRKPGEEDPAAQEQAVLEAEACA